MANLVALQTLATCAGLSSSAHLSAPQRLLDCSPTSQTLPVRKERGIVTAQYSDNIGSCGIQFWRSSSYAFPVLKAAGRFSDSVEDSSSASSADLGNEDGYTTDGPISWNNSPEMQQEGIVLSSSKGNKLQRLTQDVAMGLVLREAAGTSWTTGSGLEGPADGAEPESKEELKFPDLSKSPRRKMRVAFTCNVCGERTIRAMNPLAYTDGTVFVQCKGCDVFHKLVDNLNLFHEMKGKIYRGYDIPWYANDQPYNFFDDQ
ncbi:unnamed protein product [Calypogeia fissa]